MEVILYSTGCPKCNLLKKIMTENKIKYTEVTSIDEMQALGLTEAPQLSIDGQFYKFKDALMWARQNGG